jgi:dTDP-4-dehydrorhamnose reductase
MIDSIEKTTHETRLRIGVLGANGQLGRCLLRGIEAAMDLELTFAVTRHDIDLNAGEEIGPWLDALDSDLPDVVINAAAYTKVDSCESDAELAYQTNALAPAEWARQLAKRGVRFVHVSTDYVFPGNERAGEVAVLGTDPNALVVRTSWVFGPGLNFVVAILDQAARRRSGELDGPLKVVNDQHGSPTYAEDLAQALLELCRRGAGQLGGASGLLHLRNSGETTWYGFARAILDQAGYSDIPIDPVPTSAIETAAPRPAYSVLSCERAAQLGVALRPWGEALAGYLSGPDAPVSLFSSVDDSARQEVSG